MPAPKFSCQEQENRILQAAAACIEASSLLDFTMSGISKAAGLSMGSIYKHIQSKEDVLVALGYHYQVHFMAVVKQIFALPLPAVARIPAVQLMDHSLVSPFGFAPQLETLLGNEAILKRASAGWLEKFITIDIAVEDLFREEVLRACRDGELQVDQAQQEAIAHELVTSMWSICVGHTQVQMQRNARHLLDQEVQPSGRLESDSVIVRSMTRMMNTYPWTTPLTETLLASTCRLLEQHGLR